MTQITELLNDIQKFGRVFRNFADFEKTLEGLAGLEQNEVELNKRVDALKAQEADWQAKKNAALSSAEDAGKRAADNIASAADEARKMIEEGRKQAGGVLGAAKDQAAKLIAQAELVVEKHTADALGLAEENASVNALVKAGKEELAKVEGALAEARAVMAKFTGK